MRRFTKLLCGALAAIMAVGISGCGKSSQSGEYVYSKESQTLLNFESDNELLNIFLNDFYHRNLRYDEESIGGWGEGAGALLGNGAFFGKEWEALALSFFDASSTDLLTVNRTSAVMSWLKGIPMDKFGYVWNGNDQFEQANKVSEFFKQGWPFPNYQLNPNSPGWEFNATDDYQEWTINTANTNVSNGNINVSAVDDEKIEFTWPSDRREDSSQVPFIELDLSFLDTATFGQGDMSVGDIVIMFKNDKSDNWYEAHQADYCTRPIEQFSSNFRAQMYFDMYNHPQWGEDNTITDLKVVILPVEGGKLNTDIKLNYFRMQYDSRQANNAANMITGTKTMYEFSHDKEFLKDMMPKVMRAVQFYLTNLGGESGVISNDFFVGHEIRLDEYGQRLNGFGIGDGYWDMLSLPNQNIYTNVYFYKAIRDAAYLLRACESENITVEKQSIVTNDGLQTDCDATYESLEAMMDIIQTKFTETFWNTRTGRFHAGYSEPYGCVIDYGFVYFNLEAIVAGLATQEQVESIYSWLDGERTVPSIDYECAGGGVLSVKEKSTGDDIYIYEFAPRSNTADNSSSHYYWPWTAKKFGQQLQNGGAAIFMSYYDLMARAKYLGIENMYTRLTEIEKWYGKVLDYSKTDPDANGAYFYWNYYQSLDIDENPWLTIPGNILEGSNMGTAGAGLFGLDYVFPESALMWRAVPEAFLGMKVDANNILYITPTLPSGLKYYANENLKYSNLIYDIAVGNNFVQINTIRGKVENEKITVTFNEPSNADYRVYINGSPIDASKYTVKNGKITITEKFAAMKISVK